MTPTFEQNLKKYADIIVRIGINISEGDLLLLQVSLTDDPNIRTLAHLVIEAAYQAGAKYVDVNWIDATVDKLRVLNADKETLTYVPDWNVKRLEMMADQGIARLSIRGVDPELYADVDRKKVTSMQRAGQAALQHIVPTLMNVNKWSVAAVPVQAWADKVFANVDTAQERRAKLWDAIFSATRVYEDDPISAWQSHQQNIVTRRDILTQKQYTALHFTSDGTDLTVGLPQGHIWQGGASQHQSGRIFTPNIPTEEMFTMPHRDRVNGTVKATKPLSYAGTVIEDFSFTFEDGRVVGFDAKDHADLLQDLIDTDEGAKHLGEVALVPHSSPISQTGVLFFNTLFDENAACHIALGRAYGTTLTDGADMEADQFVEAGGNISQIHVDFMIGSQQTNIDGITLDGTREPIMRNGEWAFEVE